MTSGPRWSETVALFGGRFDPPHLGHREAVRGLFRNPGVGAVWVVPAAIPPHKKVLLSSEDRLNLCRLNFEPDSLEPYSREVHVIDTEIKRGLAFPQDPSYSYDTIMELSSQVKSLAFTIGSDQLKTFSSWHRFPDILNLCHWIVLERKSNVPSETFDARDELHRLRSQGVDLRQVSDRLWQVGKDLRHSLVISATSAPALSSTEIKDTLARSGAPKQGTLHDKVLSYLKDRKLCGILDK